MKYLFLILSLFTLSVSAQTLMPVPSTPTTANINFALGGGLACSGTNTYAASITGLTTYSGFAADLQFTNANTSTTTSVNINSLGAKSLKKYSSGSLVDLSVGDISAGARIRFYYNGTYLVMMGGTGSGGTDPNAIHQGANTLIGAFGLESKSQIDITVSSHSGSDEILESFFIDSVGHTADRSETVTSANGAVQAKIEPHTDASDASVTISTFNASNNVSLSIGSSSSDNIFTDGRATPIGFRQSSDIYASGNQSDRAWIDLGTYDRRSMKRVARCATTANITLSGLQTVDGLSLVAGDVVLVKNQTTGSQNGLYIVASGAWTRPDEFNSTTDYSQGAVFPVRFGTTQQRTMWICTNLTPITFGTTAITIAQFAGNLAAMTGILPVVNGGTGTATPALVAGTNVTITGTWPNQTINSTGGGGGTPAGSSTNIQFNTAGAFAADSVLAYKDSTLSTPVVNLTSAKRGNGGFVIKIPTRQTFGNFYHTVDQSYINSDGQRDAVYQWGYNQNGGGTTVNPAEAELHVALESHYIGGGTSSTGDFEFHLEGTSRDGIKNRYFSMNANKDGQGLSSCFWQMASMRLRDNYSTEYARFNSTDASLTMTGSAPFLSLTSGSNVTNIVQNGSELDILNPDGRTTVKTTDVDFYFNNGSNHSYMTLDYGQGHVFKTNTSNVPAFTFQNEGANYNITRMPLGNSSVGGGLQAMDEGGASSGIITFFKYGTVGDGSVIFNQNAAGSSMLTSGGTNNTKFLIGTSNLASIYLGTDNTKRVKIDSVGVVSIAKLIGTGTRLVTADASGNLSNVVGDRLTNTASTSSTGTNTITWGDTNVNNGNFGSALFGESSEINTGVGSALSVGEGNYIAGYGGVAFGRGTYAGGGESFIGGRYVSATAAKTNTKAPQSTGVCAFGFYITDTNQIANHGSGAVASAILGGRNANIPAGADFSVILGGDRMKLSSSDTAMVYVPNFRVRALRGATNIIADASGNIVASKRIAGSFTATGTATTTFTVTFGNTQAGTSYKVTMSPTSILAVGGYVTNKTTTTFDYVVPAATGTVSLDYEVIP